MKVTITSTGLGVLTERLKQMDAKVSARFIKGAGRAAMAPVLRDARANLTGDDAVETGALRDSLRITSRSRKRGDVPLEIGITVRRKIEQEDPDVPGGTVTRFAGYRWHFIETGVPARGIAARPFVRPAFDSNRQQLLDRFRDQLKRRIEKFDNTPTG